MSRLRSSVLFAVLIVAAACSSGGSSTGPSSQAPRIQALLVTSAVPARVQEGEVFTITIVGVGSGGARVPGAAASIHAVSRDASIIALVSSDPAADGAVTFRLRGVSGGRATVTLSYPCAAGASGCTPSHQVDLEIEVAHGVSALQVSPASPIVLQVGGTSTVTIATLDPTGARIFSRDEDIDTSLTVAGVATVQRALGVPGDGRIEVTVTAVGSGLTALRISHPRTGAPIEIPIQVLPAASRISVEPVALGIQVGQTAILDVRVLDAQGNPAPNTEAGVDAVFSDPTKARIVGFLDLVPGDGALRVTVVGVAAGATTLEFRYPGALTGVVQIQVSEAVVTPPAAESIPGFYAVQGTLRETTCSDNPAPIFTGPPGGVSRAELAGGGVVRFSMGSTIFEAPYDPATGSWAGTAIVTNSGGTRSRWSHDGRWQIGIDGSVVFRGLLIIEPLDAQDAAICRTRYDIEYRRL